MSVKRPPAPEVVAWRKLFQGNYFDIHNAYERAQRRDVKDAEVAAGTGLDRSAISQYRHGVAAPEVWRLFRLARFYGVEPGAFCRGWEAALPEDAGTLRDVTERAAAHDGPRTTGRSLPGSEKRRRRAGGS